jgi:hypothetical protein
VRRVVIIAVAIVAIGGFFLVALFLSRNGAPAGSKCPPTFPEFAVASKDGVVSVSGRVIYANGGPFMQGPVAINLTFMMPGCGALPFSVTTEGDGRFSADSPPTESTCVLQGGTATARTNAGCAIEGMTQGDW